MKDFGFLTPEPESLSRELRTSQSSFLPDRRKAIASSFVAAGAMQVVSLYQSGLIRSVPEPPLPMLDADEVDASAQAYQLLSVGDGSSVSPATALPRCWRRQDRRTVIARHPGFR